MIETTELERSKLCFDFRMFHLHLHCSREDGYLRQAGVVMREPTTIYEQMSRGCMARLVRQLQLSLQQRSSEIRDLTDMGTEHDGPSFYFSRATFYLQVHYSRVNDDLEERMHRLTADRKSVV